MWEFCLTWGITWETFWSLSADEEAALMVACRRIEQRRKEARRRKG